MVENCRNICSEDLKEHPIVSTYNELFTGVRKGLPKGTWQDDKNVIIIIRYVLEVRLGLSKEEIPFITRVLIKKHKLWGALNRFKSIKKLLQFVYAGDFNEFSFCRVSVNYWASISNIKSRFEQLLQEHDIPFSDIPSVITYDRLIAWGFSNPLKRHNDSPYQLINAIYPNVFYPYQFRKIPQGYAKNKNVLKRQFFEMLEKEKIAMRDIPHRVNQDMLSRYRFSGAMSYYNNSPSEFIMALFPDQFAQEDFARPQGYWQDVRAVRQAILDLKNKFDIPLAELPKRFTKKCLMEQGLGGLLDQYEGSPINILQACFPGEFNILEFTRVPNRFWYDKENRVKALRSYCQENQIDIHDIPKLSRAYFKKNYPRFVSVLDKHYESKVHLWIMETFPEYKFTPENFNLLAGEDGQLCDSKEELLVHNILLQHFKEGKVIREGERFVNHSCSESYIPDWIIHFKELKIIVEYFGLYNSSRFPGYTERADRKIAFYNGLKRYQFVKIFPEELKKIESILDKVVT